MRKSKNVKSLLAELDRREAELTGIEARVRNLDSRYKAVWAALTDDHPLPMETKPRNRKKRQSPVQHSMGVGAKDVDLTGAKTRLEQMVRVAEAAPNNEINMTQVTELLIAVGIVPPTRFDGCRTSLHNTVKKHGDCFKRVRQGWYRYTPPKVIEVSPVQWRDGDIDYADSSNLSRRLVRMAEHTSDGRLEPKQTAQRLRQDCKSSQRLDSLARMVTHNLRKNPYFREIRDDWFEWVDFTPHPSSHSEPDAVADRDSGILNTPMVSGPYMTPNGTLNGNIRNDSQEATS